jgi:hypothetical protein
MVSSFNLRYIWFWQNHWFSCCPRNHFKTYSNIDDSHSLLPGRRCESWKKIRNPNKKSIFEKKIPNPKFIMQSGPCESKLLNICYCIFSVYLVSGTKNPDISQEATFRISKLFLVFITLCLLFLYDFCHSPKKLASVSPFSHYKMGTFFTNCVSEIGTYSCCSVWVLIVDGCIKARDWVVIAWWGLGSGLLAIGEIGGSGLLAIGEIGETKIGSSCSRGLLLTWNFCLKY